MGTGAGLVSANPPTVQRMFFDSFRPTSRAERSGHHASWIGRYKKQPGANEVYAAFGLHQQGGQKAKHMAEPNEDEIRTYAHQLWEKAGRPEGRDKEFWELAQRELRNQNKSSPVRTPDNL